MSDVVISVEPLAEKRIKEFLPAGGEVYVESLTKAELLAKNAQKVDFGVKPQPDMEKENGKDAAASEADKNKHPWEGATKHLRSAVAEMSVLCDVLLLSQQRHYLLPDPVSQPVVTPQPALQLYAAKENLSKAASILLKGAEAVRTVSNASQARRAVSSVSTAAAHASSGSSTTQAGTAAEDRHQVCGDDNQPENRMFYRDLQTLCQSWAMRRTNQLISGDLALYPEMTSHLSRFEVERRPVGDSATRMDIAVTAELRARHSICVFTSKKANVSPKDVFANPQSDCVSQTADKPSWMQTLEIAEESLICRDIFRRIGRESDESWCSSYRVMRRSNWILVQLAADSWLHIVRVTPSAHQASIVLSSVSSSSSDADLRSEPVLLADLRCRYLSSINIKNTRTPAATMLSVRHWEPHTGYITRKSENLLQGLIELTSFTLSRRQVVERLASWQNSLAGVTCDIRWLPALSPFCQSVAFVTLLSADVKPPIVSSVDIIVDKDGVRASNSSGYQFERPCADEALTVFLSSCVTLHNWKLVTDLLPHWRWRVIGETRSAEEYRLVAASTFAPGELRIMLSTDASQKLTILEVAVVNDAGGLRKTVKDLSAMCKLPASTGSTASISKLLTAACAEGFRTMSSLEK
eukprot:scpid46074/ scgid35317/ Mediator of RNA polymerase II transcription subunit 17; Cofactor required for Sp1 transcriptional activation subunit 6; Mediator complex subunit 17; Thyroid hormone receptor-associated protein complex 80 kDa component